MRDDIDIWNTFWCHIWLFIKIKNKKKLKHHYNWIFLIRIYVDKVSQNEIQQISS